MAEEICISTLNEYLRAMTQWENKWNVIAEDDLEKLVSESGIATRKKELENIFEKFLSKKTLTGGQSRLVNLSFRDPPEHRAEVSRAEKKGEKKYSIYVKESNGNSESRFDLILEDGHWKLDTKAYDSQNWRTQRTVF